MTKIWVVAFVLAFPMILGSGHAKAQDSLTPESFYNEFFDSVLAQDDEETLALLKEYAPLFPGSATRSVTGVFQLMRNSFGDPTRYEVIRKREFSDSLVEFDFIVSYESTPSGIKMSFYKLNGRWVLVWFRQYERFDQFLADLR